MYFSFLQLSSLTAKGEKIVADKGWVLESFIFSIEINLQRRAGVKTCVLVQSPAADAEL